MCSGCMLALCEVLPFSVCPADRFLESLKKKNLRGMCYLYSPQFSCLLFVLCPVIRNSLLRSAYNSSSVFLGPLRTCIATASLTNGSRQGRLTWALESSGLLSHPWDDVLRAILQTQAVQQSWAELASHWHVHCFSCRGSFLALTNQHKYYEATWQTQNDWNEDK